MEQAQTTAPGGASNVVKLHAPPGVHRGPGRPRRREEDDGEAWLVSYADMITLLFCFLVILLSVSKIDVNRMSGLKNEMDKKFSEAPKADKSLKDLEKQLQTVVAKVGLNNEVRVRSSDRGLVMDFNAKILFTAGSAELSLKAMDLLDRIAGPLGREPIQMVVEGHTDPIPIRSNLYPSNWELSAARSASVVRYLITALKYRPERLQAVGMADTRPIGPDGELLEKAPVSDYWTEEYLARQRRVTLVVTPVQEAQPKAQKVGADGKVETTGMNPAPTGASTDPALSASSADAGAHAAAGTHADASAHGAQPGGTASEGAASEGAASAAQAGADQGQAAARLPAGPAGSEAVYLKSAWANAANGIDAERLSEVPYKAREGRRKMKKLRTPNYARSEPVRQTRWE